MEQIVIDAAEELGIAYQTIPPEEKEVTNGHHYTNPEEVIVFEIPIHFMHNSNYAEKYRHPEFTDEMMDASKALLGDAYGDGTNLPEIAQISDVDNMSLLLSRVLEKLDRE